MRNLVNDLVGHEQATRRLAALAPVSAKGLAALRTARPQRLVRARRDFAAEGAGTGVPLVVLSGWAYRARILIDGRRQILNFVLPGDLIGTLGLDRSGALTSVMALTDVVVAPAPDGAQDGVETGLTHAYAASKALDEHYLLLQISRLGRMNAMERVADWVLEIRERLNLAGEWLGASTRLPLTQEIIADALGLTSVHVNRTLQALRKAGLIEVRGGTITLLDAARLAAMVDYRAVR